MCRGEDGEGKSKEGDDWKSNPIAERINSRHEVHHFAGNQNRALITSMRWAPLAGSSNGFAVAVTRGVGEGGGAMTRITRVAVMNGDTFSIARM